MAYLSGYTGQELVDAVLDIVKLSGKAGEDTDALRCLNNTCYDLFLSYDWPELVTLDDSITTTGGTSYNLTTGDDMPGSGFGRIIDGSVRYSTYFLELASKAWLDTQDPDRVESGRLQYYCMPKRTDLRFWPYGSDGDTVYFDWVSLPVKIEISTTAASMSFACEHQPLIVEGAKWQMMQIYKQNDWFQQYQKYEHDKHNVIINCKTIKPRSVLIRTAGQGLGF